MITPPHRASTSRSVRVMLVDDSSIALEVLRRMVATAPELEVTGVASNGADALRLFAKAAPDVLVTDFSMPGMDGLQLVKEVIERHPIPILVISAWLHPQERQTVFRLLEAGALEVMAKPALGLEADFVVAAHDLTRKIRILSGVKVIRKRVVPVFEPTSRGQAEGAAPAGPPQPVAKVERVAPVQGRSRIVGIGASTGGPQALQRVLGALPASFPLPIVCVQHIAEGFVGGLVDWLASTSRVKVVTAHAGAVAEPGTAYFPPDDRHIEVDANGRLRCSRGAAISGHRPSVDVAFSSLALHYAAGAIGVLLTGMGADGAEGLLGIAAAGGTTIAQNEESSVVFGMPGRAIELGAAQQVLSIDAIAPVLIASASASLAARGTVRSS
jgi:two-component system chemotaxis response regulator CheB